MHVFLIRRVLAAVPVIVVVTIFVFALLHLAPGDPAAIIAGDLATAEDVAKIRAKLGLDQPLLVQFFTWIGQLLRGDLGNSIFSAHPVSELIAQRLEPTLTLTVMTLLISVLIAVPLGVIAAWRVGSWIDRGVMGFAVFGFSVPGFVIGYVLIWLFAIELDWLPVQGYTPLAKGFWPWLSNIILPSVTLALAYMALIARITRASMLETLSQDYIRTAHAKGLADAERADRTRAAQCRGPDRHRDRHRRGAADRRRRGDRKRVRDPGTRQAHRRCDPAPRLSGHTGHHPGVLGRLRCRQSRGRHALHGARPADPVLKTMSTAAASVSADVPPATRGVIVAFILRHPTVVIGGALLLAIVAASIAAPWLGTVDPISIDPSHRLRGPSSENWFGTDRFGRDLYSRVIYGGRVSLIVGLSVAGLATLIGLTIGLVSGYLRAVDAIVMRVMDGMMAIPAIMLAIALIALSKASILIVIVAVTLPEIPRVVRLVRSVVLTIREQPYIEAATATGTSVPRILVRHLLPNALPPLIVQATYICASAVLIEAALSFLGAGTPPEIPSWGNIMAEARPYFQLKPWMVLLPGVFLAVTVLAINLVGDGLRDMLDPRLARRM